MMGQPPDPEKLRDLLRRAGQKVATPDRWCQGALAKTATGLEICPAHPRAVRWCPIGALYSAARAAPEDETKGKLVPHLVAYLGAAAGREHKMTIEGVNDRLGHAAALAVMRRAYVLIGRGPAQTT